MRILGTSSKSGDPEGEAMTQTAAGRGVATGGPAPLLTVGQAAEYLRTGERFVRRLVSERRLPYVKLGKYVRIERAALDAFIESGRVPSR